MKKWLQENYKGERSQRLGLKCRPKTENLVMEITTSFIELE